MTGWKNHKVADLVHKIYKQCSKQFADARRALYGVGLYRLSGYYKKFFVNRDKWLRMTEESRDARYRKFLKTPMPVSTGIVRSTDGTSACVVPKNKGKKPYQRQRRASAKTRTPMRK